MAKQAKQTVLDWVDGNRAQWSDWHQRIFHYAETAWREYRSAAWYVARLRAEGFEVEVGSGGMPTAFCAVWSNGEGPTIAGYAEYDAVPGNCQAADTVERPRDGLSKYAGGHTDPHSALGIGALGGFLSARAAMERHRITGTLKFFGEPAEKVRGSKPIHAARGYYDALDAAISFHPFYMLPLCNTTRWDTHCGAGYGLIYRFVCEQPHTWLSAAEAVSPIAACHDSARAPGANDAVITMYNLGAALRPAMLPNTQGWSMNETILTMGQATADNLPAPLAEIIYMIRTAEHPLAERVVRVLDNNAAAAAQAAHCRWERHWVSKSRAGLANHAIAELTYRNLRRVGAPVFNGSPEAVKLAQEIQRTLGLKPMAAPFMPVTEKLLAPQQAERLLRQNLPPNQKNFTSDDYTEFCWHAPTVRLYIARPTLTPPEPGYRYPAWVMNALGGLAATIDPMIDCAAKTIGLTVMDLLSRPEALQRAKAEFVQRTGGGIGGKNWQAPLCDYPPPIDFRWPEYVTTARGENHWWIPARAGE